jgi:hypothetical protein
MKLAAWGGRLAGVVMLASAVFAAAVIWLLLTDPVALTQAVASGSVGTLAKALFDVFSQAFRGMLRWL